MRPPGSRNSPQNSGRRRGYRTLPLQPVRPLSRVYKAQPRTCADAHETGAVNRNRTGVGALATRCSTTKL